MRSLLALLTFATALLIGVVPAHSEKRIFIIANNTDGYGIDRCLATGDSCGAAAAAAYCKARDFTGAASYRKVEREEITGAASASGANCTRGGCEEFVAIECTR
jgi:hypothetical protein